MPLLCFVHTWNGCRVYRAPLPTKCGKNTEQKKRKWKIPRKYAIWCCRCMLSLCLCSFCVDVWAFLAFFIYEILTVRTMQFARSFSSMFFFQFCFLLYGWICKFEERRICFFFFLFFSIKIVRMKREKNKRNV